MRLIGYSDQGGRCDGVQIMVHKRLRLYRAHLLQGVLGHRRARPESAEDRQICRRAAEHMDPASPGRSTIFCSSSTTRTCSRSLSSPTKRTITRAPSIITPSEKHADAQLVGGHGGLRHVQPGRARADRLHAGRGHRPAPHLVCRRPLGLRVGAARRLHRLHPDHHRHGRTRRSPSSPASTGCRA